MNPIALYNCYMSMNIKCYLQKIKEIKETKGSK